MVVTISPNFNLYKIVVFPAASRPTIKIRISFLPHSLSNNREKVIPILTVARCDFGILESINVRLNSVISVNRRYITRDTEQG